MRRSWLATVALGCLCGPALAAEPTGDWLVANGAAVIRIAPCGEALCGVMAWSKDRGDLDSNNPDPAKRSRPLLGVPILLGMRSASDGRWKGAVYNAEDGRTYSAHIELKGPDVLRIEGCVMGILCGGEKWTRASVDAPIRSSSLTPGN
jgi:uncharacterized protein (DUF2147 family)